MEPCRSIRRTVHPPRSKNGTTPVIKNTAREFRPPEPSTRFANNDTSGVITVDRATQKFRVTQKISHQTGPTKSPNVSKVPPKGFEPLPFLQAFADHFGLPETKTEAILDDATLGDLVRVWSALDDVTKDIIAAIVQNRSST